MKQKPLVVHTHRKQLDRVLAGLTALRDMRTPERGWIHQIRTALGMSSNMLANRLHLAQATVIKFEQSEAAGSISLKTLERVGEALGCKLVYALLPKESLQEMLREQARKTAEKIVSRVQRTMCLEAQGVSDVELFNQIEEITNDLVRTLNPDLWKVL